MSATWKRAACAILALASSTPAAANAAAVSPGLQRELEARGPRGDVAVIVELADKVDPAAYAVGDRRLRDNRLLAAAKAKAARNLPSLRALLTALGARDVRELWLIDGIAAVVPAAAVERLASARGVLGVRLDEAVLASTSAAAASATPEWNLAAVGAPPLWSAGHTGAGAVVAGMDTGVDAAHPDLLGKWRGRAADWFDATGQHASPHDGLGHGTQTMGIMVGGSAGGTAIGVAPDARFIAARIFDDAGAGTFSGIHLAFQWLLDPDGDPATLDAPDVVNASWTLSGRAAGVCDLEFQLDVLALEAAGIAVVFAAGNDGPSSGTSDSPANGPGALSAGAVDGASTIAPFSSRGPSACDGSIFPTIVAPGVDVWTSDLSYGGLPSYTVVSGTSFAAPHVAGALALLASAVPEASVAELRAALVEGALDLGPAGGDDAYGHGLVSAPAAYDLLAAPLGSPPRITSTPVTTATAGEVYFSQVTAVDPEGAAVTFSLDVGPDGMAIAAGTGLLGWTPSAAQVGPNTVVVRATDASGLSATQSFIVTVAAADRAPVASADAFVATSGVTLRIAAPGVLANDVDPDGDPLRAVLTSGPAHGALALSANGSFSYTASSGFSGTDAFAYAASDGRLLGAPVTVTLTVVAPNRPPIASNDTFSAPYRKNGTYPPQVLAVLANDRDPDGMLVASSVRIVTAPSKGGTAIVGANGTVSYTPRQRFRGTESFTYTVKDDRGAVSNVATVTINVQ